MSYSLFRDCTAEMLSEISFSLDTFLFSLILFPFANFYPFFLVLALRSIACL